MSRDYSATAKRKLNATGADEIPRTLLEISNPALPQPIRVVNDNMDLVSNGDLYVAFEFDAVLPDDTQGKLPRAKLVMDNAGEDLTEWLDTSRGGAGSSVRFIQVLRSNPDNIEWEITMDLTNLDVSWTQVSGDLGFENLINQAAVCLTYTPETAPGLY
jgi:hypothetical protein